MFHTLMKIIALVGLCFVGLGCQDSQSANPPKASIGKDVSGAAPTEAPVKTVTGKFRAHEFTALPTRSASFSTDGQLAAFVGYIGKQADAKQLLGGMSAVVVDVDTGKTILTVKAQGETIYRDTKRYTLKTSGSCAALSTDKKHYAIATDGLLEDPANEDSRKREVRIQGLEIGKLGTPETKRVKTTHTDTVFAIAINADASRVATASLDNTVKLWNTTGTEIMSLANLGANRDVKNQGPGTFFQQGELRFSSDGETLASRNPSGDIRIWNLPTKKELFTLTDVSCESFAVSSDQKLLAAVIGGDLYGSVRVWDIARKTEVFKIACPTNNFGFTHCTVSPDGRLVAGALQWQVVKKDGKELKLEPQILIWDSKTGKERYRLTLPDEPDNLGWPRFSWIAFGPDNQSIFALGGRKKITWRLD